jgi:hypothetical protein
MVATISVIFLATTNSFSGGVLVKAGRRMIRSGGVSPKMCLALVDSPVINQWSVEAGL